MNQMGSVTNILSENLSAAREVRGFGLEEREKQRFAEGVRNLFQMQLKVVKYNQMLSPLIEFITAFGVAFARAGKGVYIANADGTGIRGKAAVGVFYDDTSGKTTVRSVKAEETFPSSSPDEIAHILNLHFEFDGGFTTDVRGIFTYKVDAAGLLTNLRGYWNMDSMTFGQA